MEASLPIALSGDWVLPGWARDGRGSIGFTSVAAVPWLLIPRAHIYSSLFSFILLFCVELLGHSTVYRQSQRVLEDTWRPGNFQRGCVELESTSP